MLDLLVPATEETLHRQAYLLANPDVAAAGVDPEKHFIENGRRECRSQFNPEIVDPNSRYRVSKLQRFRRHLNFLTDTNQRGFPVSVGSGHFSLDEYQSESANYDFWPFVKEVASNPDKHYLDLGCGLRQRVFDNCLYVEVYPSVTADLVVPATCVYPIADATFDGIGCFAVLEHTRKPWLVVQEIFRMLKPGGKVWIDWPFLQPIHGYPSHFFNATREGLTSIFEDSGFTVESAETMDHQGPDHTISWILNDFMQALPDSARERFGKMSVADLLAQAPRTAFWQSFTGAIDDTARSTIACGNVLVASKA